MTNPNNADEGKFATKLQQSGYGQQDNQLFKASPKETKFRSDHTPRMALSNLFLPAVPDIKAIYSQSSSLSSAFGSVVGLLSLGLPGLRLVAPLTTS